MKERYPNGTWVYELQRLAMPLGVVVGWHAVGLCDSDWGRTERHFVNMSIISLNEGPSNTIVMLLVCCRYGRMWPGLITITPWVWGLQL